ncbi:MAG: ROK family glucokinase [Ruminococcus sp.]|nr:ROK family glucokinase [Ruminococcus sp.]
MKYYIGIDLGGTNIKAGVVNDNYEIIAKATTKTMLPRPAEEICADMAKVSLEAVEQAGLTLNDIESVGIGTPGTANSATGIIEYSNNLGFLNLPVVDIMQKHINKPFYVENDANAAAYGEFLAGAAKGANDAVCITLGTGVGGGIIINGKIYSGFNFAGAEIGHTVVDPNGPECTCGRKGCFEVFSSATGLVRMTKEAMYEDKGSIMWQMNEQDGKVSARTAFNAMRAGDRAGKAVVDKYIRYLACGITNTINIFQPDILCIGGGVCNEGDPLLLPLKELVAKEVYTKNSAKNIEIVIAKLGNDAGIIGAAFLGQDHKGGN